MKKDLSALLAELSANKNDEDRENTSVRLQQECQQQNARLSELVKTHRESIAHSVQTCSKVIHTVAESRNKCRDLKERITNCMNTLQCNRDNIKRMWLESLEHKYAHKIFSEIEELRKVPREVNESLMNKKLEHATEVIVSSIKLLSSAQYNADALKELKSELNELQEKLYLMILEDLRNHLHCANLLDRFSMCSGDITYDDVFTNKIPKSDYYFKDVLNQISFDEPFIRVLLNCVTTMKRLPETIEFLKDNCKRDLESVSHQVSEFMHGIIHNAVDLPIFDLPLQKQQVFLIDLMENMICIYTKVARNYKNFVSPLENVKENNKLTDIEFDLNDIYSKIQAAIENFVGHYFEPLSSPLSTKESFGFTNSQNTSDVGAFFIAENVPEDKNLNLFKFRNSFLGIRYKKYSKDSAVMVSELEFEIKSQEPEKISLICRPALKNIILIFNPLKSFIMEVEEALDLNDIDHSPLYAFLYDFANLYLDQVNTEISKMLKTAAANLEAWNTTATGDYSSFRVNSEKQALSCSIILENIMSELQNLMINLPDYSNHFLRLTYYIILDYKEIYHKSFKQMFEDEQNALSVSWARDGDIRRLMKTFLNWRHLEEEGITDNIESPEEIRLRNQEESKLLIRNLQAEAEFEWGIITDTKKLTNLAYLQENLIWFSVQLLKFIKKFTQLQSNAQVSPDAPSSNDIDENSITNAVTGLRKVIKEYEDFADMCLLALHLEVRARCFYHLLPFSVQEVSAESNFIQVFDTAVQHLTRDLLQIDEVLLPILTPKEFKYVFEGLGEVVASLMILIVSNMHKINETVVLRMDRHIFTIQCCLANITVGRDVSLERARQFIDLLKSTHEEILSEIVEEGPRFNEQEYLAVFRLISSSTADASHGLDYYAEKLKSIFKRLAANAKDITDAPLDFNP